MSNRAVRVPYLARVEGETALEIKIKDGNVHDVRLKIFEPPRFFEAFLRGRDYSEAPDITARICGICPVAYQMSSVHAMEDAFGAKVEGPLRELRRLLYCGEWIESHVLHIYLLHAPDFLGFQDAIQMAQAHPAAVERGLKLKKIGNDIVQLLGGREIHPINVRVGGFYRVPTERELQTLVEPLQWAVEAAEETVRWSSTLPFPHFERAYEFVALRHPQEYPFCEGRLVSNRGLDIAIREFEEFFMEEHIPYTNALHCAHRKRGAYHVGPLARYNLNYDRLTPRAQAAAQSVGLPPTCFNPFKSIIVRAVETLYACEEALRIVSQYTRPAEAAVTMTPRAGTGFGCSEAPRGLLYHRYTLDDQGLISSAKIVPPTSQNQKTIEDDLREFVPTVMHLSDDELTWQCEQAVRNYDPCISCATHFLKLNVTRE